MSDFLSEQTKRFVLENRQSDIRKLALKSAPDDVDLQEALQQIEGYQLALRKLPIWAQTPNILFPKRLSLEQCSSEATALVKINIVQNLITDRTAMVDLTGGFGVDCSYLATLFEHVVYVEQHMELCRLAQHNFEALNLPHIVVNHADGVEYLSRMQPTNFIFIDPARRNEKGHKTVAIADCEPNICQLETMLTQKGDVVMVKLSPMLDIHQTLIKLRTVKAIHIVSLHNECKELLLILSRHAENSSPHIYCTMLLPNGGAHRVEFTFDQERALNPTCATELQHYLYEPDVALMKAGCFKYLTTCFDVQKLHPHSHLYTSTNLVEEFPGRVFEIVTSYGFSKRELKQLKTELKQANITLRNFPSSTDEVRKQLKLKEGGDDYLFITVGAQEKKMIIHCRKRTLS